MSVVYDVEILPNLTTVVISGLKDGHKVGVIEISDRINETAKLRAVMERYSRARTRMIGFNNAAFDWPVLDAIYRSGEADPRAIAYDKVQELIEGESNKRPRVNHWIPQVDLYRIHHFDNAARATSLKKLEFALRMMNIEEMPIAPGTFVSIDQIDEIIDYNKHDVEATRLFALKSESAISFREELSKTMGLRTLHMSDAAIGAKYFIQNLPDKPYNRDGSPRQTPRGKIAIKDIVVKKVKFFTSEVVDSVLNPFMEQEIDLNKEDLKGIKTELGGISVSYGKGGVHGSVSKEKFYESDTHKIVDIDVVSFYPSIPVAFGFYPQHLGSDFIRIYSDLIKLRRAEPKGTPRNLMLKLALNAVYGNSNNKWSPFYDPKYTMSVTVNGQLLLTMLAEALTLYVEDSKLIQINTDGLTMLVPKSDTMLKGVCSQWESATRLTLEFNEYTEMLVRDVNNYMARSVKGDWKTKGAYVTTPEWHKDQSNLASKILAVKKMTTGEEFDFDKLDNFDFAMFARATGSSRLIFGDKQIGKNLRFYASTASCAEFVSILRPPPKSYREGEFRRAPKVSDQLYAAVMAEIGQGVWDARIHTKAKTVYKPSSVSVVKGQKCKAANDWSRFDRSDIDLVYYKAEADKLVF